MADDGPGATGLPLWKRPVAFVAVYVGLAVVYFLPAFLPGAHVFGTDYLAAGFFKHEFTSRLMSEGTLPAWLPHVFGGVPVFANPASTFVPVKILADLVFPASRFYPAMYVVHFALAGVGMYLLAREIEVRRWAAFLSGLAFQFTGITMSAVYAGHDGRLIVATLAPLLFFFLHRGVRTGAFRWFAGAAGTLGFSLLTFQIQSNYYLLIGAALWTLFAAWRAGLVERPRALAARLGLSLAAVAFGFAMASVNFLPFMGYIDASPRGGEGGRGYEYSTSWSMPPEDLTALAVPEYVGASIADPVEGTRPFPSYQGSNPFKLHSEYVGALVLVLLLLGFYYNRDDRPWWFFAGLGAFALTIALGGHTPLYRVYYAVLPYTEKFRSPSIAYFLVAFCLVVMGARTLERLARAREEASGEGEGASAGDPLRPAVWILGGAVGLCLLVVGLAASADLEPGRLAGVLRFSLFAALVAGTLWFWLRGRIAVRTAVVALAVITVVDLWIVDRRFFHTVPPPDQQFARDAVASFLLEQPEPFRVWVLPFPRGQRYRRANYLTRFDISLADGEHGNQLQSYNEYVGAGEQTYVDWHNFLRHPQFIDAANVRYLVAGAPLDLPAFEEVFRGGGAVIYENPRVLPRAYLVGDVRIAEPPEGAIEAMKAPGFDPRRTAVLYERPEPELRGGRLEGGAEVVEHTANRVAVRTRANRRALLVLSDNWYPGWEAEVDSRDAEILKANHTFRGVVVEPGEHEVVFRFRPTSLIVGFWIYVGCLALLTAYGLYLLVGRIRAGPDRASA